MKIKKLMKMNKKINRENLMLKSGQPLKKKMRNIWKKKKNKENVFLKISLLIVKKTRNMRKKKKDK